MESTRGMDLESYGWLYLIGVRDFAEPINCSRSSRNSRFSYSTENMARRKNKGLKESPKINPVISPGYGLH